MGNGGLGYGCRFLKKRVSFQRWRVVFETFFCFWELEGKKWEMPFEFEQREENKWENG